MNGFSYISPEPMLKEKKQNIIHVEKELQSLQNGKLKSGLANKLSFYQEKLDVLGKFDFDFKLTSYYLHFLIYSCLYFYANILPLNYLKIRHTTVLKCQLKTEDTIK